MSLFNDAALKWVPYPDEDLTCEECTSTNTELVKDHPDRRTTVDVIRCRDCGHKTDRWNRNRKESA